MISFKQFIAESRSAPLYHATRLRLFTTDIMKNGFKPYTNHNSYMLLKTPIKRIDSTFAHRGKMIVPQKSMDSYGIKGISTTRSFNMAKDWIGRMFEGEAGIIVEFNQQAIAQRYKIIPINFFGDSSPARWHQGPQAANNEYEEFITFTGSIPLKYIDKIYISNELANDKGLKHYIDKIKERFGASNIITY